MKTLGLSIAIGLGDAIFISAAINNIKQNYDNIYLNPLLELAETYKNNGIEYSEFFLNFLRLLCFDSKYIINDKSKSFPFVPTENLFNNITPVVPRFSIQLHCDNYIPISEEYIVITTKIRQLHINLYKKTKDSLLNSLNKLSEKYKIVILGEREIEINNEYSHYGSKHIYNIYKDLITVNNILDLTIPKLGITVPNINQLKKDCTIMNKAKCVITLGCGGNFALASATAEKLIAYRNDDYKFVDVIFKNNKDLILTNNNLSFIKHLNGLI